MKIKRTLFKDILAVFAVLGLIFVWLVLALAFDAVSMSGVPIV